MREDYRGCATEELLVFRDLSEEELWTTRVCRLQPSMQTEEILQILQVCINGFCIGLAARELLLIQLFCARPGNVSRAGGGGATAW